MLALGRCAIQLGESAGLGAVRTARSLAIADETEVERPVGRHDEMVMSDVVRCLVEIGWRESE